MCTGRKKDTHYLLLNESCFSKISSLLAYVFIEHTEETCSDKAAFVYFGGGHSFLFIHNKTIHELCRLGMLGYKLPVEKEQWKNKHKQKARFSVSRFWLVYYPETFKNRYLTRSEQKSVCQLSCFWQQPVTVARKRAITK